MLKKSFDSPFNMVRHQFCTRLHHIELCHHFQTELPDSASGVFFRI